MWERSSRCGPSWTSHPAGGRTRTSRSNTNSIERRRRRAVVPNNMLPTIADICSSAPMTPPGQPEMRSEEHTSELQSLMRISYAVFCLKKKKQQLTKQHIKTKRKQPKTENN